MDPRYELFKKRTLQLASRVPKSAFHKDFAWAHKRSSRSLSSHGLLSQLHEVVSHTIDDDLGHGMPHTESVTLDAGTLLIVEGKAAELTETVSNTDPLFQMDHIAVDRSGIPRPGSCTPSRFQLLSLYFTRNRWSSVFSFLTASA